MSKRLESKFKIERRLGANLSGKAKSSFNKRNYGPGQHGADRKKSTDYGTQLHAKQKFKGVYGNISEKQLRKYYAEAIRRKGDSSENLVGILECRLDSIVYRMKFVPSVFAARQFVSHGHVLVNGKKVDIPSYLVKGTYHNANDEEKFIDLFENDMSIRVKSITTENMDDYTGSCSVRIEFEKDCDVAGDMVYVPAFIEKFHDKSDFKNPDRQYPVDFPCTELCSYSVMIDVADGYVIDQIPSSQRLAFAPLGASILLQANKTSEETATLQFRYKQDETFLNVPDYHDLQKFWEVLCSVYESMIVVRRVD